MTSERLSQAMRLAPSGGGAWRGLSMQCVDNPFLAGATAVPYDTLIADTDSIRSTGTYGTPVA